MEIPAAHARRLLERALVGRLATRTAAGEVALVPVVYVVVGDDLWSPIDGKPKQGIELARVRHVRRDPRVSLLVDQYCEDWQRLWWLQLRGEARVEPASGAAVALQALRAKYPQYESTPITDETESLLAIRPLALRSWCASPEAYSLE